MLTPDVAALTPDVACVANEPPCKTTIVLPPELAGPSGPQAAFDDVSARWPLEAPSRALEPPKAPQEPPGALGLRIEVIWDEPKIAA